MDQLKFYKYAIVGLVFLNIGMIAFFLLTKPKHEPRSPRETDDFKTEIVKVLDLNSQQRAEFKALADDHHLKLKSIKEQQQGLLPSYFGTLTNPADQINKDSVLREYQQLERQKLEVTYQHFKDIKGLLDNEQLPYFEEFMNILINRMIRNGDKAPRPRGNENINRPPPGDRDRNPPPPRKN